MSDWKGSGRALVVDDDTLVRRTLERSLQLCGFEVSSAASGPEAIEIFAEAPQDFTVVLLDLTMPGMDGDETLIELRKLRPDVVAVLVSGYDENEISRRFRTDMPHGLLKKPFRPRDLKEKLRQILDPESC